MASRLKPEPLTLKPIPLFIRGCNCVIRDNLCHPCLWF